MPFAENPAIAANYGMEFECLTLEQGLSQSNVTSIVQDRKGFMWFGTLDGLNRFDGYSFCVFRNIKSDSTSLTDDWVTEIFQDRAGNLWIGTLGGGLNKYDEQTESFATYRLQPVTSAADTVRLEKELDFYFSFYNNHSITSIYEDQLDRLWVATFNDGLYIFDREQKRFNKFTQPPFDTMPRLSRVTSICETEVDGKNYLWFGSYGGGLIKYRNQDDYQIFQPSNSAINSVSDNIILSLHPDPDTSFLWIGTLSKGVDRYDYFEDKFSNLCDQCRKFRDCGGLTVMDILKDNCGNLWIATMGAGLKMIQNEDGELCHFMHNPQQPSTLGSNEIMSLYQDRTGLIWIGTKLGSGVYILDVNQNKFNRYYHDPNNPQSISENAVFSFCEDPEGNLWVGTFKSGINCLDRNKNVCKHYQHETNDPTSLSDNYVRAIYRDRYDEMWIGTFNGGVNKFNHGTETFTRYRYDPADSASISNDKIQTFCEDMHGDLWIGTFSGGLCCFDRDTESFITYRHDPQDRFSISDDRIYTIVSDSINGCLWIGTYRGGLNKFDLLEKKFYHFKNDPNNANSLSHNCVFTILPDPNNNDALWIGTFSGGMDYFDIRTQSFTHYRMEDGMPNNVVYGILADDDGNLWISTNKGVSKFNPNTNVFTNYDVTDGLQDNEFNAGAYYRSKSGEMYFGGIKGFNSYFPDMIEINENVPPIVLTSFKIFDRETRHILGPVSMLNRIELSPDQNFFSFEFSALDYTNTMKNQYAYKLEGLNDDWIRSGNRHYVSYTNLDPGTYQFHVKGSNNDGVWNEEGTSIELIIHPPFWKRWWFYLLSATTIIFGAMFWHRQRIRINIRRSLELERIRTFENERVRRTVAADFHDELGQKLTRISLFSEIIKSRLQTSSSEITEYVDRIITASKELSGSTRDFIWTLDPVQDSLYDVAIYLKDFGDDLFDKTGISFRAIGIDSELESIKLPMEWRRHLILILKEGMNNILKHANCKNVTLTFDYKNNILKTILEDDGTGIGTGNGSNGKGLRNMQNRASAINGILNISSPPGSGTCLEFAGEIPQMGH